MKTLHKSLVLCRSEDWGGGLNMNIEPRGDALALSVREHTAGFICLKAIDSGESGYAWGRVSVDCDLPEDSLLRVYACSSDSKRFGPEPDLDDGLAGLRGSYSDVRGALAGIFEKPVSSSEDFYLHCTGRYLWLMLELISTGSRDPVIRGVTLHMAGDHMTDYLPAVYRGDDFTKRFLSVFDSALMDMEKSICELPRRLDYGSTDDEMLRYLASWVCIEGEGVPPDTLRGWIKTALPDYESMYTVEGVHRSVRRLTGRDPIIIENAAVDPNNPECANPALYRRLYGDDPFKFFVLLDEDTFGSRNAMESFLDRMRLVIPAGTELELVLLKKCVQLDWHTYLGVNSMVGSYIPVMIDENTTIHYDTMIGGQ